ncbi:MAG: hypothetical protein DDT29_02083 [Dehalococcoidia bacterium]|nr:hypothetical protein [Bacillota bacterium]MBT9143675.1 hypothetical protein [Bacillota bacterium]
MAGEILIKKLVDEAKRQTEIELEKGFSSFRSTIRNLEVGGTEQQIKQMYSLPAYIEEA